MLEHLHNNYHALYGPYRCLALTKIYFSITSSMMTLCPTELAELTS